MVIIEKLRVLFDQSVRPVPPEDRVVLDFGIAGAMAFPSSGKKEPPGQRRGEEVMGQRQERPEVRRG